MISIGDILALIKAGKDLKRLYSQLRGSRYEKFVSPAEDTRGGLNLYDFLYEIYYDLDFLIGPDGPFPVGLTELKPEAVSDPNSLLGSVEADGKEIAVMEKGLIEAIIKRGSDIWNGRTFSLRRLHLNAGNRADRMDAFAGSYYDMVCSADYLEYELLASILGSAGPIALDDLPRRRQAIAGYGSPAECLLNGGGVDGAIAISTLVVYKREGEYWILCDVRSRRVAEYGDLYHVIPSFIFQPVTGFSERSLNVEWDVNHNIYREYLEELFDVPEVRRTGRPVAPDYFYGHPNLVFLRELIQSGSAEIRGVSFMFSLLTHRPELLTVLVIEDEDWYLGQKDAYKCSDRGLACLNLNDEFLRNEARNRDTHPEIVTTLPLSSARWEKIVRPWLMAPPAAPALILGAKAAVEKLGAQEPDWLRRFHVRKAHPSPA